MQKTEKHCKNQCFCYHKTTKISPKTGPKTQESASGPGHLRNRKKRCCKPKNWVKKLKNTGFFHFSLADFGRARSRTGVFRTVFYSVFWRRASRPIKNRRFWPKNGTPPGKPVTFYGYHPDDHAPAPSVRADLDYVAWCRRSTVSCWFVTLFDLVRPCWTVAQVSLDAQASISWTNGEVWLKKWLPADFETWELRKHARNVAPQQRCQVFMDFEFQSFTVFEFDACTTATSFFCVANDMLADQKTSASVSWWCALLCDRYAYTTSKARCVR